RVTVAIAPIDPPVVGESPVELPLRVRPQLARFPLAAELLVDLGQQPAVFDRRCHATSSPRTLSTDTENPMCTSPAARPGFITSNWWRCSCQSYTVPVSWLWMPRVTR